MKSTKSKIIFSFLLMVCILANNLTVAAKEEGRSIKKENVFISDSKDEQINDKKSSFPDVIIEGEDQYELQDLSYEVLKETLLTKVTKEVESDLVQDGSEYVPQPSITADGIEYKLLKTEANVQVITEAQAQSVTGYTDYDHNVAASEVPQTKTVTAVNKATGQSENVVCNLTGVAINGTDTVTKQMTVTFYEYDSMYFLIGDELVEKNDSSPPLQGHENELLQMVGAESGSRITNMYWSGEPYTAGDGTNCRDAIAEVQQSVNLYRASYSGAMMIPQVTATRYKSTYEGLDPKGKKQYEIKATATYKLKVQEKKNMLPVYIGIGAGILVIVGAVIAILWILAKKKKKQEEENKNVKFR